MGLLSGIGNALFGKPAKGYQSPYTKTYEDASRAGVMNRAGARATGVDKNGRTTYDFSGVGKPVTAGTQGYDFSGYDSAMGGFKNPAQFNQTYTGKKFNFAATPKSYYDTQYELGAGDVRRENAGQLESLRETLGTRRPGLLLKAGQNSQRSAMETLAKMRAGFGAEAAKEQTNLNVQQQLANAAEAFKGYQSRADLESRRADESFRNKGALADSERNRIGLQSDVTERERAYQDQALQYLMDLFAQGANQSSANAQLKNQARGQNLGFLGGVASSFSPIKG